jgi:hypothetical protein
MPAPSSHGLVRGLETKPRNSAVPYILDVCDAELPAGSARVVARCDTRDGTILPTRGAAVRPTMREIRHALDRREQR